MQTTSRVPAPPIAGEGPHTEIATASATELAGRLRRGELSCRELVQAYLDRIRALDAPETLNAYITVADEEALAEADRLDAELASRGPRGPLHGLPIAIKDNIDTAGVLATSGSAVFERWVPRSDATSVDRLRAAGAVIIGKLNMHELAFGITSNNPHFGAVRNPYDAGRVAGGSSGGSAAAVAAGLCVAALGTDTGGSIRIPSSVCGTVGLKPTLGAVPTDGVMPLAWSLDTVGPIARSVDDAALVFDALRGLPAAPADPRRSARRVAVCEARADDHPDASAAVEAVAAALAEAGVEVVRVAALPTEETTTPLLTLVTVEAVVALRRELAARTGEDLRDVVGRLGDDIRPLYDMELGDAPTAGRDYVEALYYGNPVARRMLGQALAGVDAILMPTTPLGAVPLEESAQLQHLGETVDTLTTYVRNTAAINAAGLPGLSIPGGVTGAGLPIGVQLVGAEGSEELLLATAATVA